MRKIEVRNVCKKFDELEVLKGIDMTVDEGEVVAIIGPSGGGKSTFLRCLNKLETINGGTILVDGETLVSTDEKGNVNYAGNSSQIACKMGMVFQQFNLFPHMTVLENLMEAPVHVQKRNPAEVQKEAEALLEKVGLLDKRDQYPLRLSGGQQQRVAIARALCMNPDINIFPGSGADGGSAADHAQPGRRAYDHGCGDPRDGVCQGSGDKSALYGRRIHSGAGGAGRNIRASEK